MYLKPLFKFTSENYMEHIWNKEEHDNDRFKCNKALLLIAI